MGNAKERVITKMGNVTFEQLAKMEPKLLELEKIILNYKRKDGCINRVWYGQGGVKEKMSDLVGNYRIRYGGPRVLNDHVGYDVAYRHLYDSLPNCETECEDCVVG